MNASRLSTAASSAAVPGQVAEAWSGLYGVDSGNYLRIRANERTVPNWGVWIDRGLCNDRTTIALEPGIGYYDSLARAVDNGTAVELRPNESREWSIELEAGFVR